MALQIIGAGFGRTGTYSLKSALEQLGFGPCHHMSEVIANPDQTRRWTDVADGRPDFDAIFSDYNAAVDFPTSAYWQEIHAKYPEARVILSARDPEKWYASFSQTILALIQDKARWTEEATPWFRLCERVIIDKALGGRTDKAAVVRAFERNQDAARELAKTGKALICESRQGWGPLCEFLGVETPSAPYPRSNTRAEFFPAVNGATGGTAELAANPSG